MERFAVLVLLTLALPDALALHIVISPDEASKLMKSDDEFSKGLAGFIDNKLSTSKDVTKRSKINQLKSMIQRALDEIDGKKKPAKDTENSPPALPLDSSANKDMKNLESLVDNLLDEVSAKEKRQGWVHPGRKKDAEETKRGLERESKEADAAQAKLEDLYEKVKRLVTVAKKSSAKKDSSAVARNDDVMISDSGDVGSMMLAKVKRLIAKKKAQEDKREGKRDELIEKLKTLTKRLSTSSSSSEDVGKSMLNGIKKMIASNEKRSNIIEAKSHPKSKAKDEVSLDSLVGEVQDLLTKLKPKGGVGGGHSPEAVVKDEVAVESKERRVATGTKKRKELMAKLVRTYDALLKGGRKSNDDVEEELETISNKAAKRSSKASGETAKAISGFDVSHPK